MHILVTKRSEGYQEMRSKISLCMIVKNEQQYLPRCLASVQGVVDEIIVVDTGSTDTTCSIAEQAGAIVLSFPWKGNFSDARNASLECATGDWILFLDADEALTPESGIALRRIVEEENEGYFLKIINFIGAENHIETCPDLVFRLFRNRSEYRFRGAIHEQIVDVILEHNRQARYQIAEDVVLFHYGYLSQQIIEKDKKNRNINIIKQELENTPHNQLLRYHYGVELFRADRFSEAVEELIKAANGIDPNTVYFPKLLRYIMLACYGLRDYGQAMEVIKQALRFFPNYADLYYYGGLIQVEQKNYAGAYDFFQQGLSFPEQPAYYAPFGGTTGFRAYYQLGRLAEEFCNEEEALRYYILSLRNNPHFTLALNAIVRILNPRENAEYTRQSLEKMCDFCTVESKLLIGNIYFAESAYQLALEYFEQVDQGCLTSYTQVLKAICLMQQRRFLEALRILDAIPAEDAQYPLAKLNKILCFWLEKNRLKVRALSEEFFKMGLSLETGAVVGLLRDSLYKRVSSAPVTLGDEGMALIKDILIRTLDLGEWQLAEALLARIDKNTLTEYAVDVGRIFIQYQYLDQAEGYFRSYLRGKADCPKANFFMAEVLQKKGMFIDASVFYRQALAADPREPRHYVKLIRLYQQMRRDLLVDAARKFPDIPVFQELLEEAVKE
jgi:glycosyltransferase involved in cell wall biosynthesis